MIWVADMMFAVRVAVMLPGGDVKLVTIGIGDDTDGVHDCPRGGAVRRAARGVPAGCTSDTR